MEEVTATIDQVPFESVQVNHGPERPIPLSLSVQLTPSTTTAPGVVVVQLSPIAHPLFLRGMRRREMQPMRVRRGQWLLLPKLPVRGPHGERSCREEQVRGGFERRPADPVVEQRVCRCARNCFLCPICRNTLSVVPSDPPDAGDGHSTNIIGEPPFLLYCNHCRWDSAEVGITFEKPTGLACTFVSCGVPKTSQLTSFDVLIAQLQRTEDSAPDSLEFERLKEHFDPFIRTSAASSSLNMSGTTPHHTRTNSITAAASAALARDIPGVVKYSPLTRSRSGRDKTANKDEMPEYKSRLEIAAASSSGTGGGDADVEFMKHIETTSEVTSFEQRCVNSWVMSMQTRFVLRLMSFA